MLHNIHSNMKQLRQYAPRHRLCSTSRLSMVHPLFLRQSKSLGPCINQRIATLFYITDSRTRSLHIHKCETGRNMITKTGISYLVNHNKGVMFEQNCRHDFLNINCQVRTLSKWTGILLLFQHYLICAGLKHEN